MKKPTDNKDLTNANLDSNSDNNVGDIINERGDEFVLFPLDVQDTNTIIQYTTTSLDDEFILFPLDVKKTSTNTNNPAPITNQKTNKPKRQFVTKPNPQTIVNPKTLNYPILVAKNNNKNWRNLILITLSILSIFIYIKKKGIENYCNSLVSKSTKLKSNFISQETAVVKIGTQTWTTNNLNVATYNDGTVIPEVTDQRQWTGLAKGAWCHYNNDPSNDIIYGKLYNWFAINDPRGIAPEGFHIPTNKEFEKLIDYLGGLEIAGGKMKEIGLTHWKISNTNATNSSGFSGLPGGLRTSLGTFSEPGVEGFWWSTSENDETGLSWSFSLGYYASDCAISDYDKAYGFSLRCVKD